MRTHHLPCICALAVSVGLTSLGRSAEKSPPASPDRIQPAKEKGSRTKKGQKSIAKITMKVNSVEIVRKHEKEGKPAKVGSELFEGDRVFTGKRSKAEITMTDKSVIRMGYESEIVVSANRELQLPKGRIKFDFKGPDNTPGASTHRAVKG